MPTRTFRELDRIACHALGAPSGTWARPAGMPMDAYHRGHGLDVECDLPRVDARSGTSDECLRKHP